MKSSISLILVFFLYGITAAEENVFTDADLERYSESDQTGNSISNSCHEDMSKKRSDAREYSHPIPYPNNKSNKSGNKPGSPIIGFGSGGCRIIATADAHVSFSPQCGQHSRRICKIFTIQNDAGGRRNSGIINFKLSNGARDSVPFSGPMIDYGQTTKGEICLGADAASNIPSVVFAECEFN